jgi:hypothetical protein
MRHPFDLNSSDLEAVDLDFEEQLTDEEATRVGGALTYTTLALGEEGGDCYPIDPIDWKSPRKPLPCPEPLPEPCPKPYPIDPPEVTTMAIGEEGGDIDICLW